MNVFRVTSHATIGWRDALLALALFGAFVRAFIPAGFMPHVEDGRLSMVICTVDGAATVAGEKLDGEGLSAAMSAAQMPCAFAALAPLAPPPEAPVVSLAIAIQRHLVAIDSGDAVVAMPDFRPQAQRAPPSLHA